MPKKCKKIGGGVISRYFDKKKYAVADNRNEICVCCGCNTDVPADTPVTSRDCYVECGGQLCNNCYLELYVCSQRNGSDFSSKELDRLIELCKK